MATEQTVAGHPSVSGPRITVDPESGVAPWRQVRDQLLHLVRVGALPVGARLPTIRRLAGDLGLAAAAYVARAVELGADPHTAAAAVFAAWPADR
jgi:hypothetical protein